jgi:hypothetical protein
MKTQHTPGPWFVGQCGHQWYVLDSQVTVDSENRIASVTPRTPGEEEANARIMAAAPELYCELSHLVRLMEPLEREGGLNIPGLATLNGARLALAKVKSWKAPAF